jgi:hypothetical protein
MSGAVPWTCTKQTQHEDVKSMDYHLQNSEISFLTSASEVRSASCPKPVKPWGRHPSTQRIGGWGCPRHSTNFRFSVPCIFYRSQIKVPNRCN